MSAITIRFLAFTSVILFIIMTVGSLMLGLSVWLVPFIMSHGVLAIILWRQWQQKRQTQHQLAMQEKLLRQVQIQNPNQPFHRALSSLAHDIRRMAEDLQAMELDLANDFNQKDEKKKLAAALQERKAELAAMRDIASQLGVSDVRSHKTVDQFILSATEQRSAVTLLRS